MGGTFPSAREQVTVKAEQLHSALLRIHTLTFAAVMSALALIDIAQGGALWIHWPLITWGGGIWFCWPLATEGRGQPMT